MTKSNTFAAIILAAGMGKRMNNPGLPKVLLPIAGKPLISYVIETVKKLKPQKSLIIAGYQREKLIDYLNKIDFEHIIVIQNDQLGTGHAVSQTQKTLENFSGDILILSGDVPFIKSSTLERFLTLHYENKSDLSVLTSSISDASGYGRIIRNENGDFIKIVEEKDATDDEKKINEFNSGIYIVKSNILYKLLSKLKNNNAQKEYYLTDIIQIAYDAGLKVYAFKLANYKELLGANTYEELKNLENIYLSELIQEQS